MVRWYSALSKASTRWTVVTADEKLSAQYEHTIAVTSNGCEILKFLTQDSWAPPIVYKGFSVVRKRGFEWDMLCVALGKGLGHLGFWSACAL